MYVSEYKEVRVRGSGSIVVYHVPVMGRRGESGRLPGFLNADDLVLCVELEENLRCVGEKA